MSEKRKSKQRHVNEEDKPSKDEYAVAKFLRFGLPPKQGKLVGMAVQCFIASKAVDALLESKWSSGKAKGEALFTNRNSCIAYCNRLLQKGLFHRAFKVERKKDREKAGKKSKKNRGETTESKEVVAGDEEKETKVRERRKGKKEKKDEVEPEKGDKKKEEEDKEEEKEEKKDEEKKKKERRLKLVMHDDQLFVDGDEVYVWIYDPVPIKTFAIGLLLVLGAIGVCLFPLWPPEVRIGVYYISLAGAGFVGFLLSLIVVRFILFCIVWGLTIGKHHFWFLPNLTEDVGFFESFQPLYKHELGCDKENSKDSDSKKGGKSTKVQDKAEVIKEEDGGVVDPVEDSSEARPQTEVTQKLANKEDSSEGSECQEAFEIIDSEDAEKNPDDEIVEDEENEGVTNEQLTDEGDDNNSDAEAETEKGEKKKQ